ncbi:MAG: hypothetical protein ACTHJV_02600 [Rhizobiaceae bacterium]
MTIFFINLISLGFAAKRQASDRGNVHAGSLIALPGLLAIWRGNNGLKPASFHRGARAASGGTMPEREKEMAHYLTIG